MDLKLFFSTFLLIFLAELGDKTQLAIMSASASTKYKWSVFAGASCALVVSAIIAVIAGSFLRKVIPESYLKAAAGILFIIFGSILLSQTFSPVKLFGKGYDIPNVGGIFTKAIFNTAVEFERSSSQNYKKLAEKAESNNMKLLFQYLAKEEKNHLDVVKNLGIKSDFYNKPETDKVFSDTLKFKLDNQDKDIIESAIKHEKATLDFYLSMAEKSKIKKFKESFGKLAKEEKSHLLHLEIFKEKGMFAENV